jgi:ribosomal-protein-alanine N-acetyltransferase
MMTTAKPQQMSQPIKPNWTIQTANWRDFSQLYHLERICFSSKDYWPFWDLLGVLTLPDLVRLKAVVGTTMVGFIGGERDTRHNWGWVTTLSVLPDFRRRGIAQALLSRCEDELGMPAVRLSVRASNQAAVNLYSGAGYDLVDRWQKYYVGGEDGLVFEKRR